MPRSQTTPYNAEPDLGPGTDERHAPAGSADRAGDQRCDEGLLREAAGAADAPVAPRPGDRAEDEDESVPPDYAADYTDDQSAGVVDDGADQRVPFF